MGNDKSRNNKHIRHIPTCQNTVFCQVRGEGRGKCKRGNNNRLRAHEPDGKRQRVPNQRFLPLPIPVSVCIKFIILQLGSCVRWGDEWDIGFRIEYNQQRGFEMLDERMRRAVEMIVGGRMTKKAIAVELGVSYEALRKWEGRDDFIQAVADCEQMLDVDVYEACRLLKEQQARGGDMVAQTFILNNPDIFKCDSGGDELDGLGDDELRRELGICMGRAGKILEVGK